VVFMEEVKSNGVSSLQGDVKQAQPKLKRGRKPLKKEACFKLTRFDKDLAALVRNGLTNVPEILDKMAIDPENFNKRVALLMRKGYFVFDSQTRSTLKLGWKGYNLFAPKPARVKAAKPAEEKPPVPMVEQNPFEEKREVKTEQAQRVFSPPSQPPVQILPSPQNVEDLGELLRKGSPKNGDTRNSLFVERQRRQRESPPIEREKIPEQGRKPLSFNPPVADTGRALLVEGLEACELCKAKFKLNVKNTEQAKFGHCFCGAAFHKDCYQTLVEDVGNCVRCGRKLKLVFDRKTEEAVRGIKDAFE